MNEEDRLLLDGLIANVQRLFQAYKKLKDENEMLRDRLDVAAAEISQKEQKIRALKERIEKMEIANRLIAENDRDGKAKIKINTLIREVDRCIALLNQ